MDENFADIFNAHQQTTHPTRNIGENPRPYVPVGHLRLLHEDIG